MKYALYDKKGNELKHIGQLFDKPIYETEGVGDFWILFMNFQNKEHVLLKYYPEKGHIDESISISVPGDWEGEPDEIRITKETYDVFQNHGHSIKEFLKNGNVVTVTDIDGKEIENFLQAKH